MPRINLQGDVYHQSKNYPFGAPEGRLFTFSPDLRFMMKITKNTQAEQIMGNSVWGHRFPPWYIDITWNEPYIYHCNIKSKRRMLTRLFWSDYMKFKNTKLSLEQYAEQQVKAVWNMTMQQAEQKVLDEQKQNLMPYDKARFGDLPNFLTDPSLS